MAKKKTWDDIKKMAEQNSSSQKQSQPVAQTSRTSIRPNQASMWQQIQVRSAQLNERNRQIEQAQKQQQQQVQQTQQTQTTKPSTNVNMLNNLSSAGVGKTNLSQTRMQQTTAKNEEKKQLPTAKQGEKQEINADTGVDEKEFKKLQRDLYYIDQQQRIAEHEKKMAKAKKGMVENDIFNKPVSELTKKDIDTWIGSASDALHENINYKVHNILQKPKTAYDGFDITDPAVTTLATAGTIFEKMREGGEDAFRSLINAGAYGISSYMDDTGLNDGADILRDMVRRSKNEDQEVRGAIDSVLASNSITGSTLNEAIHDASRSAVNAVGGLGGKYKLLADALIFAGGAEEGFEEAYSKEDTKPWEARLIATAKGLWSYKVENMNRSFGYGGNEISEKAKDEMVDEIPNAFLKALARRGITAHGEGKEEVLELLGDKAVIDNFVNLLVGQSRLLGTEDKYDSRIYVDELGDSYVGAFFSTLVGSPDGGDTQTTSQSNIQNQIQNSNLNETQKEGLTKIAQENNLTIQDVNNIIEDTLGTENTQVEEKQPTTMENKPISENKQQTTQTEQKEAVNKSSEQIKENKQKEVKKQEEDAYNWESLMRQVELESGIEQEEEKVETPKQEKVKNETPKQEVIKETPQETKQVEQKNEVSQNDRKKITEEITKLSFENDLGDENDRVLSRILDGEITLEQGKKELAQKQVEQDRQTLARANKIIDEYDFDEETKQTLRESFIEEFGGKQDRLGSFNQMVENLAKGENVKKTSEKVELPKQEKKETTKLPEQKQQDRFGFANDKDKGRQKLLATKHREFNETGEYDSTEVLKLDKEIERNRNGKRTIKQWKDMAQELGRRIANKTDEEIEDIAVKSFYDLDILGRDENGKLKNITKYDKTLGKSASFDRLYASDWVNKVYEGVREGKAGVKPQINNRVIEETKAEQNLPERKREEVSLSRAKQRFRKNMFKYGTTEAIEDAVIHHMLRADELESLQNYAIKQSPNEERQIRNKIADLKANLEKNNNELKYEEREKEYKKLSIEGFNERAGGEAVKEIFWKQWDKHNAETKKVLDKNGKKVEVKARKFSKDFVDKGFIDMRGKQINNTAELADLAQIFRNPKYETLRILYVKGNTIVGQEAVSSKLPRRNYNVY